MKIFKKRKRSKCTRSKGSLVLRSLSIPLYAEESEDDARHIDLVVNDDGTVSLNGQDLGKTPEKFFGKSEYEFIISVSPAHTGDLLLALLMNSELMQKN